jgi:predicted TIM-barrel enzyme
MFSREEVLSRLNETVQIQKKPILGAGCSAGLIAKCAETAGADLIIVYSTGKSRLMGLPTHIFGDSNAITSEMIDEIMNIVKKTPVIAGMECADPTRRLDRYVKSLIDKGISGVMNFPTLAMYDRNEYYRRSRDDVNIGFEKELETFRMCHEMNIFIIAYVRLEEDIEPMIKSGVDALALHLGRTMGGIAGGKRGFADIDNIDKAISRLNHLCQIAKSIRPDILLLAHGGPLATPEDLNRIYAETDAVGFVGASSIERIPIERAIVETVKGFKNGELKPKLSK